MTTFEVIVHLYISCVQYSEYSKLCPMHRDDYKGLNCGEKGHPMPLL